MVIIGNLKINLKIYSYSFNISLMIQFDKMTIGFRVFVGPVLLLFNNNEQSMGVKEKEAISEKIVANTTVSPKCCINCVKSNDLLSEDDNIFMEKLTKRSKNDLCLASHITIFTTSALIYLMIGLIVMIFVY